jgi:hypothetical protein
MPVHSPHTIQVGTTSKLLLLYAREDADPSRGKRGLTHDGPGASGAFIREGEGGTPVALVPAEVGTWTPGGFVEVDRDLLPGVYQLGAPDEMLAPGSTRAMLVLQFAGVVIDPVEVDLVAFDPQDPVRLGMSALGPEERIAALKGAFPRLAAKEIEERMAMKERD